MKTLKLLSFTLFILAVGCTNTSTQPTTNHTEASKANLEKITAPAAKDGKGCICPRIYMPVCGENNVTYSNSCEAECVGVKFTLGACEDKK